MQAIICSKECAKNPTIAGMAEKDINILDLLDGFRLPRPL